MKSQEIQIHSSLDIILLVLRVLIKMNHGTINKVPSLLSQLNKLFLVSCVEKKILGLIQCLLIDTGTHKLSSC